MSQSTWRVGFAALGAGECPKLNGTANVALSEEQIAQLLDTAGETFPP